MKSVKSKYPKKKFLQDLIFIFIIGLTPLLWFKSGHIIDGADVTFPLAPIKFFLNRFFSWNYLLNTGVESAISIPTISFHGVQAFFYWLTNSLFLTQKISYCFWFILICLSIYYFITVIQKEQPDRLQRLVIVLIYVYNPFVFNMWEAAKAAEISCLIAIPVLLAFFIQGLEGRMNYLKASIFAALISLVFTEIGASPSVFAIPIGICATYFLFFVVIKMFSRVGVKRISSLFGFFILFFVFYILVNTYWILPYSFEIFRTLRVSIGNSTLGAFNLVDWLKSISTYTSILNVARFQGAWDWYYAWVDEPYIVYAKNYFNNPFLLIMSIALPVLAYMAILFKRSKEVAFFTLVALIGTLFATGAHPPFGNIFLWILERIPLFSVFRSPYYKFSLATLFAYAYLVSVSISSIYKKCNFSEHFRTTFKIFGIKKCKFFPNLLILILIVSYLGYNFPMLTGKIIPQRKNLFSLHLDIPGYVFETAKWLEDQGENFRLLSLPQENIDTYRWGYGSPTNLLNLISDVPVIWGGSSFSGKNEIRDLFYENIYKNPSMNIYKLLQLLNVKYIWLRHDCWYDFYGGKVSPQSLKKVMAKLKGLNFKKRIGEWEFYEVASPANLINVTKKGYLIFGDIDALLALANRRNLKETVLIFNGENEKGKVDLLFKEGAIEKVIFFNYRADLAREEIEKNFEAKNLGLNFIYTTDTLPFEIKRDHVLSEGIKLRKIFGFSEPEELDDGKEWLWLYTNKEPNIIITNANNTERYVGFNFNVFSYNLDRNLYIYLNNELLRYSPTLKANEPTTISLKNLTLLPGKNVISFYTPYSSEKRKGRSVAFAFRDFRMGSVFFKGNFFVPIKGYYSIEVFPCSLGLAERDNIDFQKGKEFILNDSSFNLDCVAGFHLQKQGVFLDKGMYTFKIDQFSREDYYIEVSKETPRSDIERKQVHFTKHNPTKYEVRINSDGPYFLIFNESYNPNWRLYANNKPLYAHHFKVNGYANAWYIDKIKTDELFIEYWPQRLFYIGSLISVVSICLMVGSVVWIKRWKR